MTKLRTPVGSRAPSPQGARQSQGAPPAEPNDASVGAAPLAAEWLPRPESAPEAQAASHVAQPQAPEPRRRPVRAPLPAQPTPWQRAERLVDELLLEGTLAQAMKHKLLVVLRQQLAADLAQLPHGKAKVLCTVARAWAGPHAAAVAQLLVLNALLEHSHSAVVPRPEALNEAVGAVCTLQAQRDAWRSRLPKSAALLQQLHMLNQSPPDARGRVALGRQLLLASISPPAHQTDFWLEVDREELHKLFNSGISPDFFAHVAQTLQDLLPARHTLWAAINWTLAVCCLEARTAALDTAITTRISTLRAWHDQLRQQVDVDDAALCARLLATLDSPGREQAWQVAVALHGHLPKYRLADLVRDVAWLPPAQVPSFAAAVREVVPPWAHADEAAELGRCILFELTPAPPGLLQAFGRLVRPEHSVTDRHGLLVVLSGWYVADGGARPELELAAVQHFVRDHSVPSALTAQVVAALAQDSAETPQLRPALQAVLRGHLADERALVAIHTLLVTDDVDRLAQAQRLIEAPEGPRSQDLETAMGPHRIRASDHIVAQVLDRLPGAPGWRQTLQQIAAALQAAQVDPTTDPLLLSPVRTGVSELDNALHVLQGPRRPEDASGALLDNPTYVLGGSGRVVGLGQLAAALWQLLRDQPMPAATPDLLARERRRVRVDFMLALARGVEDTGHRVCGFGLSEQLTEACTGYIEGIQQGPQAYPEPLLRGFAMELAQSELCRSRRGQEAFYHDALRQAAAVLMSPEAVQSFGAQWLAYMRDTYGWPTP